MVLPLFHWGWASQTLDLVRRLVGLFVIAASHQEPFGADPPMMDVQEKLPQHTYEGARPRIWQRGCGSIHPHYRCGCTPIPSLLPTHHTMGTSGDFSKFPKYVRIPPTLPPCSKTCALPSPLLLPCLPLLHSPLSQGQGKLQCHSCLLQPVCVGIEFSWEQQGSSSGGWGCWFPNTARSPGSRHGEGKPPPIPADVPS